MIERLNLTKAYALAGVPTEIFREHLIRYVVAISDAIDKHILDVACGSGYGLSLLSRFGKSVTGIDYADEAIQLTETETFYCPRVLYQRNLETDEIPGTYDLITCYETLEHLSNPEFLLGQLRSSLNPGGKLYISTPKYEAGVVDQNPHHKQSFTFESLKEVCERVIQPINSRWFTQDQWGFSLGQDKMYAFGILSV